mgnify:CR=1 FL=1
MSYNIINAIINLISNPILKLRQYYAARNRANSVGGALEEYIKDLFAGTIKEDNEQLRLRTISKCFSYTGNQNNPPDCILKGGDAIEVKKLESRGAAIALNSSYPKAKLFSDSSMITKKCRNCEDWVEKDLIYTVGVVNENTLKSLCMVYGIDYAASADIYERVKTKVSTWINAIPDLELSETNELGRVNRVDPLGITYLRIRGMWNIENPMKVFEYVYQSDENKEFNFMAIINVNKYNTFSNVGELEKLVGQVDGLNISDVEIKTPDNPAELKQAKLITFTV